MFNKADNIVSGGPISWAELTVNEAIRRSPRTVAAFNRFGIDACCGGAVPIPVAAARDGADLPALLVALDKAAGEER